MLDLVWNSRITRRWQRSKHDVIAQKQSVRHSRAEVEFTLYAVNMPLSFQSIRSLFEWLRGLPALKFSLALIKSHIKNPRPMPAFLVCLVFVPAPSIIVSGPLKPHQG
jgi:hypothetical protein